MAHKKSAQLVRLLQKAEKIPLFPFFTSFPIDTFFDHLAKALSVDPFDHSTVSQEWVEGKDALSSSGLAPIVLSLEISQLTLPFFIVISEASVMSLAKMFIYKSSAYSCDITLAKEVLRCLVLEAMHSFSQLSVAVGLTLQFSSHSPSSIDDHFRSSYKLKNATGSADVAVLIPQETYTEFSSWSKENMHQDVTSEMESSLMLPLTVSVGSTTLNIDELNSLEIGDVVVLDAPYYFPNDKKGYAVLSLEETELYQASIKKNEYVVLQQITINAVEKTMDQTPSHELTDEDNDILDQDFVYDDDEFDETGEHTLEEDVDQDEEDLESDESEGIENKELQSHTLHSERDMSHPLLARKDIPIHLTIEVGSFTMSLSDILALQVGNVIPTQYNHKKVTIVSQSSPVAKGTLVQIGDTVGVQIDEILK